MNELSALATTQLVARLDHCSDRAPSHRDVEQLIGHRIETLRGALGDAARHHFATPGKMLRAKMALRGAAILNIDDFSAIRWASAIEVLHNASLIHDDLCDGDKHRRGQQSIWSKFGRNTALALGDWLVALSFEFAGEAAKHTNAPNLVSRLAGHMARTTAGVAHEFEWCISKGWARYLEIAGDKTAPFLTAPTQGVVIMAGNEQCEGRLIEYFSDLGKAYQIANDIAEFSGNDEAKIVAGDLAQRRPNAVVLAFADGLDQKICNQFKSWFQRGDNQQLGKWSDCILGSDAMRVAASKMMEILKCAEEKGEMLPPSVAEIVNPVHVLVQRVCISSTEGL
jgi:geranylgeranyl pyrophosphate synthase